MIVGGRVRFMAAGRALKHRNFRLFFFGQLISVTGTWMQSVAQGWLLVTMVGSNQAIVLLGLLGVAQFLPVLVLGLFGGIIADIWPKRYTVIGTQTAAGMLALTLGALVYFNEITVWQIFVLAFLLGLVNAVDMPARQSFVVEMVGPRRRHQRRRPQLGRLQRRPDRGTGGSRDPDRRRGHGVLLHPQRPELRGRGRSGCLPCAMASCGRPTGWRCPGASAAVGGNLGEGLRYVWHTPIVLLAISVIGFVSTFGMNFNVVLPVLAAGVLKVGPNGLGLLYSAMGAGALIAALGVATLQRPRVRVLVGGGMVLGVAELVLAEHDLIPDRPGGRLLLRRGRDRDCGQRQLAGPDHRPGAAPGSGHERVHDGLRRLDADRERAHRRLRRPVGHAGGDRHERRRHPRCGERSRRSRSCEAPCRGSGRARPSDREPVPAARGAVGRGVSVGRIAGREPATGPPQGSEVDA